MKKDEIEFLVDWKTGEFKKELEDKIAELVEFYTYQFRELSTRVDMLESSITGKDEILEEDSGYNPKMVFTMPRQSAKDKRKVLAIMDLPNVVNTCLNEKASKEEENPSFCDPKFVEAILKNYVYIYDKRIDRIWIYTTPDYDQINEYIRKSHDRIELVVYKNYDKEKKKWLDTDNPIKEHLKDLYDELEIEDPRISRIILFSGDGDYYNEVGNVVEKKRIPFYIIGHKKGFSPLWKQLISVNHKEDLKKLRELVFTYRYYKNKSVEDKMNEVTDTNA